MLMAQNLKKVQNEKETLQFQVKQLDGEQEFKAILAEKDMKIAKLCEQIEDQNSLKQELEKQDIRVHKQYESSARQQDQIE